MDWINDKLPHKTRSHVFKKESNCSMSYVIQDLFCLPCQEEKLILFNSRQILTTEAHRETEDAPAEGEFPGGGMKLFSNPEHLAAHNAADAFMLFESWAHSIKWNGQWNALHPSTEIRS